jgi:hypothetical protein
MTTDCAVTVKTNYGNEQIYPANETAILFCQLLGQRTLTRRNIDYIKRLGFKVTARVKEVRL